MNELELKLWQRARKYVHFLRWIPGLRMVAVCNSLAMGNIDNESDIDLFIVARKGYLFTVRFFVTAIFQILGVRRYGEKIAGRFCLSFFVDDSALDLSVIAIENDLYLKKWIETLVPLIDDGVYADFMEINNRWLEGVQTNVFGSDDSADSAIFEKMMRKWQLKRAHRKMKLAGPEASLIANEHMLKFHNVDRRREYRDALHGKRSI